MKKTKKYIPKYLFGGKSFWDTTGGDLVQDYGRLFGDNINRTTRFFTGQNVIDPKHLQYETGIGKTAGQVQNVTHTAGLIGGQVAAGAAGVPIQGNTGALMQSQALPEQVPNQMNQAPAPTQTNSPGSYASYYGNGGKYPQYPHGGAIKRFNGATHENGGIPLDTDGDAQPDIEVEDKEVVDGENGRVFSQRLKTKDNKGKKVSYADLADKASKPLKRTEKYAKKRPYDEASGNTVDLTKARVDEKLNEIFIDQETTKIKKGIGQYAPTKMAYGGWEPPGSTYPDPTVTPQVVLNSETPYEVSGVNKAGPTSTNWNVAGTNSTNNMSPVGGNSPRGVQSGQMYYNPNTPYIQGAGYLAQTIPSIIGLASSMKPAEYIPKVSNENADRAVNTLPENYDISDAVRRNRNDYMTALKASKKNSSSAASFRNAAGNLYSKKSDANSDLQAVKNRAEAGFATTKANMLSRLGSEEAGYDYRYMRDKFMSDANRRQLIQSYLSNIGASGSQVASDYSKRDRDMMAYEWYSKMYSPDVAAYIQKNHN